MSAVRVINQSPGILTLPARYGGVPLAPGQGVVINDTIANVTASFAHVPQGYLNLTTVPAGQVGALQPQDGTATLVAGTVTISNVTLTANSKIMLTHNTPGGTVGYLSAPSGSRTTGAAGSFVINSSSNVDTSTVDWVIVS